MAFQFCTGFDFYTTPLQIWDATQGTTTISSASARFGGTHSQGASIPQNGFLSKNLSGNQATVILGMAIKLTTLPTSASESFMQILDAGTIQVSLGISNLGVVQFYRGAPTTNPIGSSGSTTFTGGVWHYLEISVTVNNTTGVVQCWLDGVQIINSSSLNTRASANNFANQFRVGEFANNIGPFVVDDLYCLDGSGGSLNAPLGDRRITTLMPNGAGTHTQFTPVGVASNWDCVNEIPADDATTYVSDAVTNDRDSYTYESIAINGNADFIVPWARISKDDAGSHTIELSATDTANDAFSPAISVPSSFGYVNGGAFASSPNGAAAWSQTVINRTEWGIKLIS